MSISAEDLKVTQKYYEKVKELSGSSSSGRDADVILSLIESINYLSDELAEAQAQVEGLVGAIQRLKDRMTTGYIDCEGPYEDICATRNPLPDDACWVCITSLWLRDICAIFPTEYLAQAQRREAVIKAAIDCYTYINHDAVIGGSMPRINNLLAAVEAYQKGGA